MVDQAGAVDLASRLVESYSDDLAFTVLHSAGCDPVSQRMYARQFFLGNGGCWSIGYIIADSLRGELSSKKVPRTWHPHEFAGALNTDGFSSSFVRILERDDLGEADLVHLLSGSGRSRNIVDAAKLAERRGASVLAHCGYDGGRLRSQVPEGVHINRFDQQIVEDALLIRLWPGLGEDQDAIAVAIGALVTALRTEIANLASAASAIADAIGRQAPIVVVAADVAAVSASAEHVAHNLSWDVCWDAPKLRPLVHFAISNGLLTAMANDSGVDSTPFEYLLRYAEPRGIVLNLGHRRILPKEPVGDYGISRNAFEHLAVTAAPIVVKRIDGGFLRAAFVQIWGHVLLRLTRALVGLHLFSADETTLFSYARQAIAPRIERND